MSNRISSAYQQFSQQVHRQGNSNAVQQVDRKQELQSVEDSQKSTNRDSKQLEATRKAQLRQLRETGTLKNLRSILSEDEETLLQKLFSGQNQTYNRQGEDQQFNVSAQTIKGGFFDQKF